MTTEAGKLYLDWDRDPDLWDEPFHERFGRHWTYPEVIAAIEAEAVASERGFYSRLVGEAFDNGAAQERARIAEAVRALDVFDDDWPAGRAAVLAIVEKP